MNQLYIHTSPLNGGDIRDASSVPGSGRSLGSKHGNSLRDSCLKNSMDREAWQTIVQGSVVAELDMAEAT